MKRFYQYPLVLLLMLLFSMGLQAQDGLSKTQRLVGYIEKDSITARGGAFGIAGTYSVGACMGPEYLSSYTGCKVVGIRLAVNGDRGRARTFIYTLDSENNLTTVVEQKQKLYDGWNNVFFNGDGYELTGEETLFFGFDYTETQEMIEADEGGLCGYGSDYQDGFYLYGTYNNRLGLYSISGLGCLCVQLIIDISSLPLHDIDITWMDAGFKYKQPGENIDGMINYVSVGQESATSYRLGYQLDDQEPVSTLMKDTLREGKIADWKYSLTLPTDIAVGMHRLSIFVNEVNGEPMPVTSRNDTLSFNFAVYRDKVSRHQVYMEVYTDQESLYAPFLNEALAALQADKNYGEILTVVNVHKPGSPLAVDAAAYLHDLYAYTLPAFTVNRAYFPGEAHIAYDMNDYLPVLGTEMNAGIISGLVAQDIDTPSFATIELQAAYDPTTRQLSVTAGGSLLAEAEAIYGNVALTLMLTENGVKGSQVQYNSFTGRTTTNKNYTHNQVLRSYLTSPLGDALTPTQGSYETSYTTTLPAEWKPENLTVVALLTKEVETATADGLMDLDIINANRLSLTDITGIGYNKHETITNNHVYDLQGRRVAINLKPQTSNLQSQTSNLKPGLYIVNGKKYIKR